jgi:hypothetical protein
MSSTLKTCPQYPRQLRQNRKAIHLKHETFCPTKRGHLYLMLLAMAHNLRRMVVMSTA